MPIQCTTKPAPIGAEWTPVTRPATPMTLADPGDPQNRNAPGPAEKNIAAHDATPNPPGTDGIPAGTDPIRAFCAEAAAVAPSRTLAMLEEFGRSHPPHHGALLASFRDNVPLDPVDAWNVVRQRARSAAKLDILSRVFSEERLKTIATALRPGAEPPEDLS
ncbi:MAG: hypothetical protein LBR22_01975 [Desulfovibrio sp.]|jgi:hypothetical protein|nr:hypothetical protein [Desulfovibrio sp.]